MSPHALRQRMRHGNVYPPERTQVALDRFFTEANLTALRELSLRLVARKVEGQLEGGVSRRAAAARDRPGHRPRRRQPGVETRHPPGLHARGRRCMAHSWRSSSRRLTWSARSFDRSRDLQEAIDDAVDLGAEVVRVEARDTAAGWKART